MFKPELTDAAEVFAQELEKVETALEASKADVEKLLRENGTLKIANEAFRTTHSSYSAQGGLPNQVSQLQYVLAFRQKAHFRDNAKLKNN